MNVKLREWDDDLTHFNLSFYLSYTGFIKKTVGIFGRQLWISELFKFQKCKMQQPGSVQLWIKTPDQVTKNEMYKGDHEHQWRHNWFCFKKVATCLKLRRCWTDFIYILFIIHYIFITATPKIIPSKAWPQGTVYCILGALIKCLIYSCTVACCWLCHWHIKSSEIWIGFFVFSLTNQHPIRPMLFFQTV
jgi:hypothetical protein